MTLSNIEKKDLIVYRIDKSDKTFDEALKVAELGMWSLAVNRLYYSAFYMALAVNINNGDSARTHSGVFSIISQKYIATGILSKEEGQLYRRLFSMRQSGDYDDLFDWEEEDVKPLIPQVEELLAKFKSFLQK